MRKKIFSLSILLSVLVLCLTNSVLALSQIQKDIFDSGIMYYDHETGTCDPTQTTTDVKKVYIIGDSITVGTESLYRQKLSAKGVTEISINGANARSWKGGGLGTPTTGGSLSAGKDAVEEDSAKILAADVIVVALGTNGGLANNPIPEMLSTIRSKNNNARVWWVNTASSRGELTNLGDFNRNLTNLSQANNFQVIDWFNVVNPSGDPNISPTTDASGVFSDGLHPNENGKNKLSDLVVNSVTSFSPLSTNTETSNNCQCSAGGTITAVTGPISMTASDNIPEPHKAIIERAASKYSVNPNFIAALFLSEQGNIWKPINSTWNSSGVGASGPFQFMPATWRQYKDDGNGDGITDIQNFEDAAFAAAKLAATGTNQATPLGDINKPFVPNTLIYFSAAYNWGGGNLQRQTNPDSPLTVAPEETEEYMKNVFMLLSSNFTKGGHKNYGDPRMPGQPSNNNNTSIVNSGCPSTGNTIGSLTTTDPASARNIILSSSKIKWGNYGSATSQKADVASCLTNTTLSSFATIAQNSPVDLPINALATDHGGCTSGKSSLHNAGRAIDIGYYGNNSYGAALHKAEGDTLYKFLFDNRDVLQIDELIWQYPPVGYKCIDKGVVGECDTLYSLGTMNQHYHHIHVSFKS